MAGGWNGSGGVNAPKNVEPKAPSKMRGLVALVVVVVLAALGFIFFPRKQPAAVAREDRGPKMIREADAVRAVSNGVAVAKSSAESSAAVAPQKTNLERFDQAMEELQKKAKDNRYTNQVFRTGTEQIMSWIFTTRVGDMPPPPVAISIQDEKHMAEILISKNPVNEGDSEKVKTAKLMVEQVKDEVRKYLKEGGDVKEFLKYYREQLLQANQEWRVCQKEVMKTIRDDPAIAADFLKEVNTRLAEKGIKPVSLSPALREKLNITE